jgi:ankyrin repeat protein
VPLLEAMVGGHEHVIKLLLDNGANLRTGDTGQLACTAAEQNNLTLLKEIPRPMEPQLFMLQFVRATWK